MSGAPIKMGRTGKAPFAPSMGKNAVEKSLEPLPDWMTDPSKLPKRPPRKEHKR